MEEGCGDKAYEDQGYDDKEDESLGMRTGKESDHKQSDKARRDDSYGKFGKRDEEHREISKEGQGYDDKEDESLGMRDGKDSGKDDDDHSRRDQSRGDYGHRDEGSIMKEMLNMLSEVGAESSEEPEQPLSQHDDPSLLTAESAEDAPADDLQGDEEELVETETDDQREFKVAEDEELTEWANDAGKNGTDTSFEQDIDFMTKVISGGLNKQKSTGQTTIPVIAGQNDRTGYNGADSINEGSVMSHDGLAGLMNKMDELSK
jgi:hypothetical protein